MHHKLENYDWLYNEYVVQTKSMSVIATDLGVTRYIVNKWIKLHNIPITPKLAYAVSKLENYDWLYTKYIVNNLTYQNIADELNTSKTLIKKWIKFHKIQPNRIYPHEIYTKLENYEWMYTEYVTNHRTIENISRELGVSETSISSQLKKHNIKSNRIYPSNVYSRLENYDWLYGKYVTNHMTLSEIQQILGISDNSIIYRHLDIHGIQKNRRLNPFIYSKLENYEWMYTEYVTNHRTIQCIADELGVGHRVVNEHLMNFKIQPNKIYPHAIYNKLGNYNWLYNEYVTFSKSSNLIADELNTTSSVVLRSIHNHGIDIIKNNRRSVNEVKLSEYVKSLGLIVIDNFRIGKIELDIYLPELNIGFEFNGLYWHSDKFKSNNYHLDKLNIFKDNKIQIYHIWEDDYLNKKELIHRFIEYKCNKSNGKVFARNCKLYTPTKSDKKIFLNSNHIQGNCKSNFEIALTFQNEIVALLCMDGKILTRYCTSLNVVGGFSKLLNRVNLSEIITFSDNAISNGDLYKNTGFTLDGILKPDYKYIVNNKRIHKFNFRKIKFKNSDKLEYIEGMTEQQLAKLNGMLRIYDAGKIRWKLKK